MPVREVRKRSGPPIYQCVGCGVSQVQIGKRNGEWLPVPGGHVCGKDPCREKLGLPRFVPPDEKR